MRRRVPLVVASKSLRPSSRASEGACGDVKDSTRDDERPLVEAESDDSK